MYRIRFHGRGGQGIKTASRILGTAFFRAGFEVQDAPRYGAERSGAPIFAYVRAAREPIRERGVIASPDLVVVGDDSLVAMPTMSGAGVLAGIGPATAMLIASTEAADEWRRRLSLVGPVFVLPLVAGEHAELRFVGATCAGAAAGLLARVIGRDVFADALREEVGALGEAALTHNLELALSAYDLMSPHAGSVGEGQPAGPDAYQMPEWVELPLDPADAAAPAIHAATTSVEVKTGLWRVLRPVLDVAHCNQCWWVCTQSCPDSAISVDAAGIPVIDYDHCKGCLICVAQCPAHAIAAVPEKEAA
jgi:pyruvate ferredoxin oxidoreductase gamma subunit